MRAKFRVESVTEHDGGNFGVLLFPVTGGSPENEEFYKYTPAGKIELSTINAEAAAKLRPGMELYVDFTPVNGASS